MKEKHNAVTEPECVPKQHRACSEPVAIPRGGDSGAPDPGSNAILLFAAGAEGLRILRGRKHAPGDPEPSQGT